ncbi:MAG: PAS domain S-box protein [Thermodesulfobacteriota bacterium]
MKIPVLKSFKFRIMLLGIVAWLIPLAATFLAIGLFCSNLKREFHRSLAHLETQDGRRFQEQQYASLSRQIRQKALDAALEVTQHLQSHPHKTWEDLRRDQEFRSIAAQPIGVIGQTFLFDPKERRILIHEHSQLEGQEVGKILGLQNDDLQAHLSDFTGNNLYQLALDREGAAKSRYDAYLVPVPVKPPQGPDLMVAALPYPEEMDQITAPARTIFKTALNLSQSLLDTQLGQFHRYILIFLVILGGLGTISSLTLVRHLTRQLASLTKAAEAYNAGDLDYRLPQTGADELGRLAQTLDRMAVNLKENTVSKTEWENTFNVIPDQIMVLDTRQRILRLNRAAAAFFGLTAEEAIGRPCYELMHQTSVPSPSCIFRRVLERGEESQIECCMENHDRTFLVTLTPIRDLEGKIIGGVHVARDITTHKLMEKELAQTSHFLNQLIDSAPLAVGVVNREGVFTHVNPQAFKEYGYSSEEILNTHYARLYASEGERRQILEELRERGEVLHRQVHLRHKDGHLVPSRLSIRKLWGDNGELLGSVTLGSNISEEISLQQQLEKAQKQEAIATLAGGLAHNFNNLLTVILGLTSLMLGKTTPEDPLYTDLKNVENQALAGQEITKKLLTFCRPAINEIHPLDLNQLVQVTADMFAQTRKELNVTLDLAPDLPAVEGDRGQMQQVLMNLLINAWQAMPAGGEVRIRTWTWDLTDWQDPAWEVHPGPYVCLSVRDTGEGMDAETLSRLFEPFFTTKTSGQGSGLGLASAQRIIKNHRGAIQVSSQKGQGSTFTLFLPASPSPPQSCSPRKDNLVAGQGTVLVVDDEPLLRNVAARLLECLGYRVLTAPGGESAVQIFQENNGGIDLVLLDLIMPGINGLQTWEQLRAFNPEVRVLFCSGCGEEEKLPPGVDFLSKPYSLQILSEKVAAALSRGSGKENPPGE